MSIVRLADPAALLLLPLLVLLLWDSVRRGRDRKPALGWSDLTLVRWSASARPAWMERIPLALSALALALVTVALARPQSGLTVEDVSSRGVDIMLCLDTSGSMACQDLQPDRVGAARAVSGDFVRARPDDRLGLVVFASVAISMCPLTVDHDALLTLLDSVKPGVTGTDATAIGNALATCTNRLKGVPGKSKVIILLTDGRSNTGEIDPITAAKVASRFGIRIYCVGVGTRGPAPMPVHDPMFGTRLVMVNEDLDETALQKIADLTGGKYYRATDNASLAGIYQDIDRLEKTTVHRQQLVDYHELYAWFLTPGLALLLLAGCLERTVLAEVP